MSPHSLANTPGGTAIFWFRRDLRLEDNAGLFYALKENPSVLPLFIFDTQILDALDDRADRRVEFIHQSLTLLKNELEKLGSSLLVLHGNPVSIFKSIDAGCVYTNRDYEGYARRRDEEVAKILTDRGIGFRTFKDQVIFEALEVAKDDGTPYTVFTPYSRKWRALLAKQPLNHYPTEKHFQSLAKLQPLPMPSLNALGFKETGSVFPDRKIQLSTIKNYHLSRNFPAVEGTTRLSVHLRFGTVSIRRLVAIAQSKNETWLNELIWRDFYQMILSNFPHAESSAFKAAYDRIQWRNNTEEFEAWCSGRTGYPIVDAGMRELNASGFMHNRVRMITASFLTKHLLIDWRWGEAYFAKKLLDFDLAANNGGWQWAAGSGCDATPYFRVFNPTLQALKFDPQQKYIRHWVPELDTPGYPPPLVDHAMARERALKTYAVALKP